MPLTIYFNVIQISPTTNTIKATLRAKSSSLTNSQARPKKEYSKQELVTLRHKHVSLTGLPAGTI